MTRLAAFVAMACGVGLGFCAPAGAACPPEMPCPRLPEVDMERVVLAASLDPARIDTVKTSGAAASVERVEQALRAKGLLAASAVDGYFGSTTTAAWGKWEKRIGQSSVGTLNGLPGLNELEELGTGRFHLVNRIDVGKRVQLTSVAKGGNSNDGLDVVNERTQAMFLRAQSNMRASNEKGWDMVIVQGGYCGASCAADSKGTHSAGGAIDIRTKDTDTKGINNRLAALKRVGFAAYHRTAAQGFDPHIHATAINDYQMTWEMYGTQGTAPAPILSTYGGNCQVYEWKFNFDALGGCNNHAPSNTNAQKAIQTWEQYLAGN